MANNAMRLRKAQKTVMGAATAATCFGKESYEEAVSASSSGKVSFIVDKSREIGFFEIARLSYLGVIVVHDAATVAAAIEYLERGRPVAAEIEKPVRMEQDDVVSLLFESAGEKPQEDVSCEDSQIKTVSEPEKSQGKEEADPDSVYPVVSPAPVPEAPHEEEPVAAKVNVIHQGTGTGSVQAPSTTNKIFDNIVASYSPSTSVGKTFTAVNAAAWLAGRGAKVALVDLDPDKADLWHTTYMDSYGPPRVTVSNWADIVGDPVQHISTHPNLPNLYVIPGTTVVGGPLPDPALIQEILCTLAGRFDVVVADLNALLRLSHITTALRMAGKVFLLSDLSEKCVAQTSMIFSQASGIVGRERMSLVVNRVLRGQLYRPRDVAKMFGFADFSEIPDDPKTVMSCLKSRRFPVTTTSGVGNALSKCFEKELSLFAGEPDEPKTSKWKCLARLWRRD